MEFSFKSNKQILGVMCIALTMTSCANMGAGPQGGAYDFDPPVLVRSYPENNSTNVGTKKIELTFDENVQLKEPSQRIIVTPPQKKAPIYKFANRNITVELRDSLLANTTYTIDFTNAIEDYNQNNPLENFSFSFSTGNVIDTLTLSGKVVLAENIEPMKGIYVGLHSNLSDTAFTKIPFERISKTNEAGEFIIRGIPEGKYHVFALDDKNRDYMYDNIAEIIAFKDSIVSPLPMGMVDSYNNADSILMKVPDPKYDIVLKAFQSANKKQYFRNAVKDNDHKFTLNFGAPTEQPKLNLISPKASLEEWALVERNNDSDSIYSYWLIDPVLIKQDTLKFDFSYFKTDSLNQLQLFNDTLSVINRQRRDVPKKKDKKDEIKHLTIETNVAPSFDIYEKLSLTFEEPIKTDLKDVLSLKIKSDTVFKDVDFTIEADLWNPRKYFLNRKWNYGEEYQLQLDSLAVESYYGLFSDKLDEKFVIKKLEHYSNLAITVAGDKVDYPLFMELLNEKGEPIRKAKVIDDVALFKNVNPGKYYARLIVDRNNNFKWDTGDYFTNEQPEAVYYYPNFLDLKAYWDHEEVFNLDLNSLYKPEAILKNKPKDKSERERLMEQQDAERYKQEKERKQAEERRRNPMGNYSDTM